MSAPAQPRDTAGRFASYDPWEDVPPIPVPQPMHQQWTDPANPQRTVLAAPRCPHGHFARWAAANCRGCAQQR